LIDHNNAFDHVAKNGNEWATAKRNSHHSTTFTSTHCAIDADNPWWTAKTWCEQAKTLRLTRN
jgi:hypothetical protein